VRLVDGPTTAEESERTNGGVKKSVRTDEKNAGPKDPEDQKKGGAN